MLKVCIKGAGNKKNCNHAHWKRKYSGNVGECDDYEY